MIKYAYPMLITGGMLHLSYDLGQPLRLQLNDVGCCLSMARLAIRELATASHD